MDDLGQSLQIDGNDSIAVVYLLIDGIPVSSIQSNAGDGMFMFAWNSPQNIDAGPHNIQVRFNGGRDWVDPIGEGDSANPDFYYPSSDTVNFTVAVPTKILLLTQGGQVDREDTLTVQGRLLDIVDNPLAGETIEIWLGGVFYDQFGSYDLVWWVGIGVGAFSAIIHLPVKEMPLSLRTKAGAA